LRVNTIDEAVDRFVFEIMLNGKKGERPARFGGSGLLPPQTRQVVHPDDRRDSLPAPLNDDMLTAMLHISDERGKVRFRLDRTDPFRNHYCPSHAVRPTSQTNLLYRRA
jgi:hypothetical protein